MTKLIKKIIQKAVNEIINEKEQEFINSIEANSIKWGSKNNETL